jgi:hypothetical protein
MLVLPPLAVPEVVLKFRVKRVMSVSFSRLCPVGDRLDWSL